VIAVDCGPNREVLGGAGRIVGVSPHELAVALREVPVSPDAAESAEAKRAARRFAIDSQLDRMLELYASFDRPEDPERVSHSA
jgi:hypothetical protein